jgi:hypothetical protein
MAQIICPNPKCKHVFDNTNAESLVTRGAAALVGAGTGAYVGGGIGLAAGPLGAANGFWAGAGVGAVTGWFAADQFRRCPKCGNIFKT